MRERETALKEDGAKIKASTAENTGTLLRKDPTRTQNQDENVPELEKIEVDNVPEVSVSKQREAIRTMDSQQTVDGVDSVDNDMDINVLEVLNAETPTSLSEELQSEEKIQTSKPGGCT